MREVSANYFFLGWDSFQWRGAGMLSYFLMACLLCVVCTVFYYLARVADEKTRRRQEWEQAEYRNSDAYFYKAQTWLESQLQHADLPDSVIGQQRYIYQTLMRGWFDHLAAENRYDVDRLKRFRGDWLEYLDALVEWRSCNFLALEGPNESKRHNTNWRLASRGERRGR